MMLKQICREHSLFSLHVQLLKKKKKKKKEGRFSQGTRFHYKILIVSKSDGYSFRSSHVGTSLVVQWLRLCTSTGRGVVQVRSLVGELRSVCCMVQ